VTRPPDLAAAYLRWTWGRAVLVSHALMGTAMIATGLVTDFAALVATQMLWGLSWTFASGADVAWITDELDDSARISVVLVCAGRADLTGAAAGIVNIGALGSVLQRSTAMVLAGAAMLLLGLYVLFRFPEVRFVPTPARRWAASWSIFVRGLGLVRATVHSCLAQAEYVGGDRARDRHRCRRPVGQPSGGLRGLRRAVRDHDLPDRKARPLRGRSAELRSLAWHTTRLSPTASANCWALKPI
jgi:hypothetical protein